MSCAVVTQAAYYLANGSSQQHHQVGHYYYLLLLLLVFLGSLDLSMNSLTPGSISVDLYVRDSIKLATAPTVQPLKFDNNPEQFKIISTQYTNIDIAVVKLLNRVYGKVWVVLLDVFCNA